MLGQGQGDETLTGGEFPDLAGILTGDADRLGAELRQARIVDDQHGVFAAEHLLGPLGEQGLQGLGGPRAVGDELLEVVFFPRRHDRSQGLHALPVSGTAQAAHVERCPGSLGSMAKVRQEGREPGGKVSGPARERTSHSTEASIRDAGLHVPTLNFPEVQLVDHSNSQLVFFLMIRG